MAMTDEEKRLKRNARQRERYHARIAAETPEQKEARRERLKIQQRERRKRKTEQS